MNELTLLVQESTEGFHSFFGYQPEYIAAAPGRINIIGEHTDYNEGLSMPAAINRWVVISGSKRKDKRFTIRSRDYKEDLSFEYGSTLNPEKTWHKFAYGALNIFFENHPASQGADIFILGNVPVGSGVSSSASLLTALFNFLRAGYRYEEDLVLVKYCQQTEHRFLGVKSGILDQYASQFSKQGKLIVLDFKKPSHYYVEADLEDRVWVLADTKVKRELSASKYSERVNETKEALDILKSKISSIQHFRDIQPIHIQEIPSEILRNRISHYMEENLRVEKAVNALKKKDFISLGNLLNESQASLRDLYEVSCKELDFLASKASNFEGCEGSRMMGGGFGGCTINLVKKDRLEDFKKYISTQYKKETGNDTELNVYEMVDGAFGRLS